MQSEQSGKTVKSLLSQIELRYKEADSKRLSLLLKEVYNNPELNTSGDQWKGGFNDSRYHESSMGALFAKVLDAIRAFQYEKLKKGINYAFKLHIDVLSSVLKLLD